MPSLVFLFLLVSFFNSVVLQGTGSGNNGNLRLCIVEGRGSYKRGGKYCPILDDEKSGIECVLGTDRLDCIRRISKGTVDFGAFSPEDLVAAQWARVDVLATNELRHRNRAFSQTIAAVVNRRILPATTSSLSSILRNRTLCSPITGGDDLHPLSYTLTQYLESLVTTRSCDPKLSLTENRIKATAEFFGRACRAGDWVPDAERDAELKSKYPQLCAACASGTCKSSDLYWGDAGALNCIAEGAGDVTWAEVDDVVTYFKQDNSIANKFAYLCRDGSWQAITDNPQPCGWLQKPWTVIVSKRKASAAVSELMSSLNNSSVTVDRHWHGALAALLELHQAIPEPLQPPQPPMDYLANALGFREAYSQHGCDPPRHITICTTSLLSNNKCEWLAEAGAVYGVTPPLQCARRDNMAACSRAVKDGDSDVLVADSDWLVAAERDYSLKPLLHEATPIIEKTDTVVAYVRKDSNLQTIEDLRGKKVAFPRFDGHAFHSVLRYLSKKENKPCKEIVTDFFSEICAPVTETANLTKIAIVSYTKNCYREKGTVIDGEQQALQAVVEGKSDVAFFSMNMFNKYKAGVIPEAWARNFTELEPICPEDSQKFCFISWSNLGHVFARTNLTSMRRHEIINVFTKLDQLFGKKHVHSLMFSMYGAFNHELDVLFHNNTKFLATDDMFKTRPFVSVPLNFERGLNLDSCLISDLGRGAATKISHDILFVSFIALSLSVLFR